jgi:hypothetical protein
MTLRDLPVGEPTTTIPPNFYATGDPNYPDSELRHFEEANLKAASRGTWTMADQLDPKTFQRLANLAVDDNQT